MNPHQLRPPRLNRLRRLFPQTASDIPLFALIGFLSVGAAFGVRNYAKRTN